MSITTAFTNNTNQTVTIGGRSIKPGETREVDARFVPATPEINRQLMVLFINLGITPRYFGTTVVQPGHSARLPIIHFENPNKADAGKFQVKMFEELLARKVDDIKPFFSAFNDEELEHLSALEVSDQNRKSLVKLIADELAVRKAERDFDPASYAQTLEGKDESELQIELLAANDNQMKLSLIQDALSKLKEQEEQA
ncbi:ABC transporter ATPase [Vibrio cholerae]